MDAKRDEFNSLADLLMGSGSDALLAELHTTEGWGVDLLSDLLVFLAPLGGQEWPSYLHSRGANLDFVDEEGQCALSQCVHGARTDELGKPGNSTFGTAAELLALGANPNASYLNSYSVTCLATNGNQPDFVALFLLAGANLDLEEPDRFTSSETLRDAMLNASEIFPGMKGEVWPKYMISIAERASTKNR